MSLLQAGIYVTSHVHVKRTFFISAVTTMCALLFALVTAQAQTAPTSIVVSPANPFISTTQMQQFSALSGNTIPLQGIVQIGAGDLHTCALLGDGTVSCWGRNNFGQLGDGSNSDRTAPVPVSGLSGVTAIAAGEGHSCALLADGTVRCWGWNDNGQLGNGSTTDSTTPVTVSGLSAATAIATAGHQTCALLADGTMRCWGHNGDGELGNGTNTDSNTPVTVILPMKARAISIGFSHSCALMADGTVRCWGHNTGGELGDGSNTDSNIPVVVSLPSGTEASAISTGDLPSCAVVGVRAYCWGYNAHGELGNGTTTSSNVPVMVVTSAGAASAVAAGFAHACGLEEGIVSCWGYNQQGQLGDGSTTTSPVDIPTTVMLPPGTLATAITTGEYHSCALLGDGTAQCWGSNQYGQLGTGSNINSPTPVAVAGNVVPGIGADHIAAGADHGCAALSDGTAQCWGSNQYGQLGNSSNSDSNTPVTVNGLGGATAIATGDHHSCAALANGDAVCWGRGVEGQVGNGLNDDSNTPVPVSLLSGAAAISAGAVHSCALIVDGAVKCWGSGIYGQLGVGGNFPTNKADQVHGLSQATAVTAGSYHTCAVLADGTVQCWGYNVNGQLGNGSTTDSNLPVSVSLPVGTRATAIAAGGYHTCALLADGTVQCWGYNGDGELGNGTTVSSTLPVTVSLPAGTRATAIAAGTYHTCALVSDGTVRCWGYNGLGELGNGSTIDSSTPVTVTGLAGVKAVTGGLYHTCAELADGTVRCWGYNGNGEFGDGSNSNSNTPVASNALAVRLAWSSGNTSVATIGPMSGLATPFSATSTGTSLITATFGALTNSTTLTVGIAPQFTSGNAATFTTGTLGTFTVTTNMSASPTPSISYSGALPSGVIFVDNLNGTATLSGTPAANTGGVYPLMITASNGLAPDATQSFTLTVNQPPAITSANTATFTVGVPGTTFTVAASGYPHSFTFGVTGLPSGLTLNTSTGVLSGTPAAGTSGSYSLTFTASNGVAPDATQNFTLNVNGSPSITSGNSATFKVGTAGNFTVTASGFPIPSISETGSLPAGVSLTDHGNGTATLGGTPHATGTFHVVMRAHNGIGSDATQNFTLTVNKGDTTSKVAGPTYFSSGQVVTLTATVSGGTVAPTGTVKFSTSTTGAYVLGTVTLGAGGTATLKTKLPNGTNYIHVDYSGDGNYSPSTSPTLTVRMY